MDCMPIWSKPTVLCRQKACKSERHCQSSAATDWAVGLANVTSHVRLSGRRGTTWITVPTFAGWTASRSFGFALALCLPIYHEMRRTDFGGLLLLCIADVAHITCVTTDDSQGTSWAGNAPCIAEADPICL